MDVKMEAIKKTPAKKKKLMLWIDIDHVDFLEAMEPRHITVQSKIRQILTYFMEAGDEFGGL